MALRFCTGVCVYVSMTAAMIASLEAGAGGDPFADHVIEYQPGSDPASGYTDMNTIVGSPERFSGENTPFPSVVSCFSPPFNPDEIVSIGLGGWITVEFDEAVNDDASNPFGIDLLVFGATFLNDLAWPEGIAGDLFVLSSPVVEVSEDGERWEPAAFAQPWGFPPTIGWLDTGPYDATPGVVPSDFTRPVDPSLAPEDLFGFAYVDILDAYDGSGGGCGIDLAPTGLASVRFVRISVPADALGYVNIDAVADVAPDSIFGDLTGDGLVDGADLGMLLASWGACESCSADLDGNGEVDGADLGALLAAWS
jgi:hypothetical protein